MSRHSRARSRFAFRVSAPVSRNNRLASSRVSQRADALSFLRAALHPAHGRHDGRIEQSVIRGLSGEFFQPARRTLMENGARPFSSRNAR